MEQLWALAVLLSNGMQRGLAERGLTLARAALMWQLQLAGPSTQHALSRALEVTPRNITGLVDGLEAAGLVTRAAHPTDRRATLVSLTDRGVEMARALRRGQDELAQTLFADVSAEDLASFMRILDPVLKRIRSMSGFAEGRAEPGEL